MASRGTHREVMANRPDIIIKNIKEKTCILIDVAIPADRNVMQKETEKKKNQDFKYRDTANVEHEMYDYSISIWSHYNRFKDTFVSHTRKHSIDSLQKAAILRT